MVNFHFNPPLPPFFLPTSSQQRRQQENKWPSLFPSPSFALTARQLVSSQVGGECRRVDFLLLGKKWGKGESFFHLLQEAAVDATQKHPHHLLLITAPSLPPSTAGRAAASHAGCSRRGGSEGAPLGSLFSSLCCSGEAGWAGIRAAASSEPPCG